MGSVEVMAMLATRWSPWQELLELEREMTDLTQSVFGGSFNRRGPLTRGFGAVPAVDVLTRDSDLVVRAELPGIDPEKDVDVEVVDGRLRIRGERREEQRSDRDQYVRVESVFGAFERTIPLPERVNADDISATYENGILEVVIPKAAEVGAGKRIPILTAARNALTGHKSKSR